MFDSRRYVLFDHLAPWGLVAVLLVVGFLTASGTPQPGMNPFDGGQYESTFRSGHQLGRAFAYGFVGLILGAGLDWVLRKNAAE